MSLLFNMSSCSLDRQEFKRMQKENQELKKELIELRNFRDSLKVIPYIDNTTFKTIIGEPYYLQLLSIIPNDIEVQDIEINGDRVDLTKNKSILVYNEYGPRIRFMTDSAGTYEFKLNAKFDVYDGKMVPLSFPIEVRTR